MMDLRNGVWKNDLKGNFRKHICFHVVDEIYENPGYETKP